MTDETRGAWLLWASQGEYSDRSEWPVALYPNEELAKADVERGQALHRELFQQGRYLGYDEAQALWDTPLGRELRAIVGDACCENDGIYLTCQEIVMRDAIAIAARSDTTGTGVAEGKSAGRDSDIAQGDAQ